MYNSNSAPLLTDVLFINNSTTVFGLGGGMYNSYSSPYLNNVSFINNSSGRGGAIDGDNSSLTLTDVSFINNSAIGQGGAIYNNSSSSVILDNVVFEGNSALDRGGAIYSLFGTNFSITNAIFINNTSNEGGAVYNSVSTPTFTNVTFANNTATSVGGCMYNSSSSSPTIQNSICWGNGSSSIFNSSSFASTSTFYNSIIENSGGSTSWNSSYGTDGGNNLDVNPLFLGATNLSLQTNSPAIDAGDNTFNTTATDLAGNSRINNSIIDLGAYEYYSCLPAFTIISDTIFQDETYIFGGLTYNTTGTYNDTLQTWQSCDSIINLNLLVLPVTYITDTFVLGESYIDYYCFNVSPTDSDTLINIVSTLTSNNCLTFYGDNLGTDSTYYYTNSEKVYFYLTVENGVWPGDTDDDAFVNNSDLLNIGLAYGTNGIQRDSQTIQWNGYLTDDWGTTFVNGLDYKHADADGNGIVNAADTLAIVQNWGLSYNKNGGNAGSPVYLAMDSLSVQNNMVSIPLMLGTAQEPLTDLYGVVFSLAFDDDIVATNSMNIALDNNTWFGNASDIISIQKEFSTDEVFEYGITRINQNAVSGYGQIGYLNFELNQNVFQGNDSLFIFEISNVIANDNIGTVIPMQGITDDINLDTIAQIISSTENIITNDNFKLYPNPTISQLNIEVVSETISEINILNMNGKQLKNILCRTSSTSIDLNDLPNGVYFVKVTTNKGIYTSTFLKL